MAQRRARGARGAAPSRITALAPVMLVRGPEDLLAERAVMRVREMVAAAAPEVERTRLSAATYEAGQLDPLTSPSLFGESRLVEVPDLELMSDALLTDLLAYLDAPAPDVWLLLVHNGGQRGKKLLDAIKAAGMPVEEVPRVKYASAKAQLVREDVARAGRRIDPDAVDALVAALGSDLRSLMAAVAQLLADIEGVIGVEDVRRYYAGRVEVQGFNIAEAAVRGRTAHALTLLRHAFATGVDPVPIVSALGARLRNMAVSTLPAGMAQGRVRLEPWQAEEARRDMHGWTDATLAAAIRAVATADEETKGASRDPQWAVENLVLTVCRLRGR